MNEANKTAEELQNTWTVLFPTIPAPDARQWALWITLHGQSIVRKAIAKLATRYQRTDDLKDADSLYKFASTIMSSMSK